MSGIKDILETVEIRYPGEPQSVLLAELIANNEITGFLRGQYPDVEEPGHVQFIPEIRGRHILAWSII